MKKSIMYSVWMIIGIVLCLCSCDNQQTPQEEVEDPISVEFLKNRKILSETRVFFGGRDTTEYTYDVQKRLIKKKMKQYYYDNSGVLNSIMIREDIYSYVGVIVTNTKYDADFYYKNGEIQDGKTHEESYVSSITTYLDTTYSRIKSIKRDRDNYLCIYEYDELGREISYDEKYRGQDYNNNECNFHNVGNYIYDGKSCIWVINTFKDDELYEVYEGISEYADDSCKYILVNNREYTKYPPVEDYYSQTRYNNRKIKTEQSYVYDEYFRVLKNTSKRYTISGTNDKLEYRYIYSGKQANVEYYIDDQLSYKSEITYIDL